MVHGVSEGRFGGIPLVHRDEATEYQDSAVGNLTDGTLRIAVVSRSRPALHAAALVPVGVMEARYT